MTQYDPVWHAFLKALFTNPLSTIATKVTYLLYVEYIKQEVAKKRA